MAGRQSRLERTFECTLGCLCERSLGIQIHMHIHTHIHTHMYVPCGDTYVSPATLTPTLALALALLTIWSCSPWHTTTAHRIAAPLPRSSRRPPPFPLLLHQECCAKLPPLWFMCKLNSVCLGSEHPAWFSTALSSQFARFAIFSALRSSLLLALSPFARSGLVSKLNLLELCPVCRLFADTKH